MANALDRFLSNLTAKVCGAFENCVFLTERALGEIINFNSSEQTPLYYLYKGRAETVPRRARVSCLSIELDEAGFPINLIALF